MHYCSDFSDYETTYSEDERIARQLQKERQEKTARQNVIEQKRKTEFEKIFNHKEDDIFKLRGLTILKFTYLKVKFMFLPSQIVQHVCTKVAFFCSLKYLDKYGYWSVKRDSFPVSYKWRIYPLFYENGYHKIDDISLPIVIERIYKRLEHWANKEELFRLEKFMEYQNGEDVYLDSDDEELFLNEYQRQELHNKRKAILARMVPPKKKPRLIIKQQQPRRPRRKVTRKPLRIESGSTTD